MKRRKKLILELTPLLDVILIMMFFVLMQNNQLTSEKLNEADKEIASVNENLSEVIESVKDKENQYKEEISDLNESLLAAKDQLKSIESFEEYCQIISVCVINREEGKRVIIISDGKKEYSISFDWDSLLYAKNGLKDDLLRLINERQNNMPSFISFHYDGNVIFKRDFELVTEVLGEITNEVDDVYVKYTERVGGLHE